MSEEAQPGGEWRMGRVGKGGLLAFDVGARSEMGGFEAGVMLPLAERCASTRPLSTAH